MNQSKLKRNFDKINSENEVTVNKKRRKLMKKKQDETEISYLTPSSPYLPRYEKDFISEGYNLKLRNLEFMEIEDSRVVIFDQVSQIQAENYLEKQIINLENFDPEDSQKSNSKKQKTIQLMKSETMQKGKEMVLMFLDNFGIKYIQNHNAR